MISRDSSHTMSIATVVMIEIAASHHPELTGV